MAILLILLAVIGIGYLGIKMIANTSDDDDDELYVEDNGIYSDNGITFVPTLKQWEGESNQAFRERLVKTFSDYYGYEDKGSYSGSHYNLEFYAAGLAHHASAPFVTFGIAIRDKNNAYSSRAVALVDYKGKLLGFIPEKALNRWYEDTEGETKPIIIFCYREGGILLGNVYTYEPNAADYDRMATQYSKLLKMHS